MPKWEIPEGDLALSDSQLDMLARCPHMWYRRYVLKEPQALGVAMMIGRAVHKGVEANFRFKKEHGYEIDLKEAVTIYREEFDRSTSIPTFTDLETLTEDKIDWGGQDPKELREQGEKAMLRYLKEHAPFITPKDIELPIQKEIMPGVWLIGVLDLVAENDKVIDYKTVNYAWPEERVEASMQPTVYATLLGRPVSFEFHFITKRINTSVGISVRRTGRTDIDINWLVGEHLPQVVDFLKAKNYFRAPGIQCFSCSFRKGCGYRI